MTRVRMWFRLVGASLEVYSMKVRGGRFCCFRGNHEPVNRVHESVTATLMRFTLGGTSSGHNILLCRVNCKLFVRDSYDENAA